MNAGPTSERIYVTLKRLLGDRRFRPGERLDPAKLGDELHSSVTPVRDALHVLVGERLVDMRTSEGFFVPLTDEPGLQDLYVWNDQLLQLAIRSWSPDATRPQQALLTDPPEGVPSAAQLFDKIAAASCNAEHPSAISQLNDRLRAARLAEAARLAGTADELLQIEGSLQRQDAKGLRKLVAAYHRRRVRAAADIVRLLYRGGSGSASSD